MNRRRVRFSRPDRQLWEEKYTHEIGSLYRGLIEILLGVTLVVQGDFGTCMMLVRWVGLSVRGWGHQRFEVWAEVGGLVTVKAIKSHRYSVAAFGVVERRRLPTTVPALAGMAVDDFVIFALALRTFADESLWLEQRDT